MTLILAGLVVALLLFHVQQSQAWARERTKFVHALLSRGPADFAALERLATPENRGWLPRKKEVSEDGQDVEDIVPVGL